MSMQLVDVFDWQVFYRVKDEYLRDSHTFDTAEVLAYCDAWLWHVRVGYPLFRFALGVAYYDDCFSHLYHSDVLIVDDVTNEVSIPICGYGSVVVDDGCDVVPFGGVALARGLVVASRQLYGVDAFDDDVGFFRCGEALD